MSTLSVSLQIVFSFHDTDGIAYRYTATRTAELKMSGLEQTGNGIVD